MRTRGQTGVGVALRVGLALAGVLGALCASETHAQEFECGLVAPKMSEVRVFTPEQMALAIEAGAAAEGAFDIVIVPGPALQANSAALGALERAAQQWEAVIRDPITVTIDADFGTPIPGALASTNPVVLALPQGSLLPRLADDATDEPADVAAQRLAEIAAVPVVFPPGFSFDGNLVLTKASAKALSEGEIDIDAMAGNPSDGRITFGANVPFDFNRGDGVPLNLFDFETLAVHEIGHALGFLSITDVVETFAAGPQPPPTTVLPLLALDLFRFAASPDARPDALDFTARARSAEFGVEAMFDDIDHEFRFSTGRVRGDGRQASHWKANEFTRVRIGVMDPTFAPGEVVPISAADLRAFDLIGYEIAAGDALPAVAIQTNGAPSGPTVAVVANQPVQFGAQASDADSLGFPVFAGFGNPGLVSLLWNFGALAPLNGGLAVFGPSPQVRFDLPSGAASRTFPVSLTAFDALGDASTRSLNVIASEPPKVSISANGVPLIAGAQFETPGPVRFDAIVSDADGLGFPIFAALGAPAPISFLWSFDGGQPSSPLEIFAASPSVTFELGGSAAVRTFVITLTAFDQLGLSTTRSIPITIVQGPPVIDSVIFDGAVLTGLEPTFQCSPSFVRDREITLGSQVIDPDPLGFPIFASFGNDTPIAFVWSFGGGQPSSPLEVFSANPRVRFPVAADETRSFSISLTVFDATGKSATRTLRLEVSPEFDDPIPGPGPRSPRN